MDNDDGEGGEFSLRGRAELIRDPDIVTAAFTAVADFTDRPLVLFEFLVDEVMTTTYHGRRDRTPSLASPRRCPDVRGSGEGAFASRAATRARTTRRSPSVATSERFDVARKVDRSEREGEGDQHRPLQHERRVRAPRHRVPQRSGAVQVPLHEGQHPDRILRRPARPRPSPRSAPAPPTLRSTRPVPDRARRWSRRRSRPRASRRAWRSRTVAPGSRGTGRSHPRRAAAMPSPNIATYSGHPQSFTFKGWFESTGRTSRTTNDVTPIDQREHDQMTPAQRSIRRRRAAGTPSTTPRGRSRRGGARRRTTSDRCRAPDRCS